MELHRSLSARSGLTPPPRFLSMKDTHGNEVVSELSGSLESTSDSEEKARVQPGPAKSGRHRHRRNSNLPSMSPSRSSSSVSSSFLAFLFSLVPEIVAELRILGFQNLPSSRRRRRKG